MDFKAQRSFSRGNEDKDVADRQRFVEELGSDIDWLKKQPYAPEVVKGNIENYIGTAKVPVGVSGPLLIHGDHAVGSFYVPLATTEGSPGRFVQ